MSAEIIADKYEVLGELGRGGMGHVYKVLHRGLNKVYALKELREHLAEDASLIARFHNEARIMASLRHDNIIQVFDIDRDGDRHYFVMEYIDGQTLGDLIKARAPLPVAEVIDISRQIAEALDHAHQQQPPIIHRDIKPSNIMLESATGRVVVTDFGIARLLDAERTRHTLTGFTVGTPTYAAPEQLKSSSDLDGRVDIFPLGLVMYEMLAGRFFFEDMTPEEIIGQKLFDPRELTPEFGSSVPMALQVIIRRAMAKDREQRYPSVVALLDDLRQFESGDTLHIAPTSAPKRARPLYWLLGLGATAIAAYAAWSIYQLPDQLPETESIALAPPRKVPTVEVPKPVPDKPVDVEPYLPEITEPKLTVSESSPSQPVVPEPVASEPIKPEPEPVAVVLANPAPVEPEPELPEPVASEPIAVKTDKPESVVPKPELTEPEPSEPENSEPTPIEPVAPQPIATAPAIVEPVIPSSEEPKPEPKPQPKPLPTLKVSPVITVLAMPVCSQQQFSIENPESFGKIMWSLNTKLQSEQKSQFTFEPQVPGTYTVQAQVVADDINLNHRWRVDVEPVPFTEADVNRWINRYQQTLQNQDSETLRQLGDLYSESEITRLQKRQRYQVALDQLKASSRDSVVDLSFTQVERWYNPKTYSSVVERTSRSILLERDGCRGIVAKRDGG